LFAKVNPLEGETIQNGSLTGAVFSAAGRVMGIGATFVSRRASNRNAPRPKRILARPSLLRFV
jgi:hypothetical protein